MNRFYSARTGAAFRPEATAEMTLVQAFSAIADFAVEAVVSPARGHIADAVFVSEIASGGKGFDLPTLSDKAAPVVAVFGMAELNAQAIEMRQWSAVGPAWKLTLLAVVTAFALFAVIAFAVRLSLFAPATIGRGQMVSLQSMSIARGGFWSLLVGLVVTAALKIALVLLWGAGLMSGTAGWIVFAVVLTALQAPLTMAFVGAAYRRLEPAPPR